MIRTLLLTFTLFTINLTTSFTQNSSIKISALQTHFSGNLEKDAAGNDLESAKAQYGFSLALVSDYEFSYFSGFRTEIGYAQKKYQRNYNGAAYRIFDRTDSARVIANGQLESNLSLTHHYFDLPLMFYFRTDDTDDFGIEVAFGPQISYLFQTSGSGSATFSGNTEGGSRIPAYTTQLKYNYEDDDEKTFEPSKTTLEVENGGRVTLPQVTGAYYDARTSQFNRFNKFDLSLNADFAVWFTKQFGLRFRANFGLLDVTNNQGDFSRNKLGDNKTPTSLSARNTLNTFQLGLNIRL